MFPTLKLTTCYYLNYLLINMSLEETKLPGNGMEAREKEEEFDYSQRSQWLRAAVLGANDGLVSTASLMVGVGAVRRDDKAMILSGIAGLFAGACSMAIGEFVSVYSQRDIELSQMKRDSRLEGGSINIDKYVYAQSRFIIAYAYIYNISFCFILEFDLCMHGCMVQVSTTKSSAGGRRICTGFWCRCNGAATGSWVSQ